MTNRYLPIYLTVFISAFLLTVIIESQLIPRLRGKASQPIYDEGPSWHRKKGETPTMGGLAFLVSSTVAFIISAILLYFLKGLSTALNLLTYAFLCIGNSLIGLFDDLTKLRKKENAGLSPLQKIFFQTLVALFFFLLNSFTSPSTFINLIFVNSNNKLLYYSITLFLILGIVNCANLTDGIDGLASGVAYAVGISYFLFSASANVLCACISLILVASSLSFLIFNINPAKIFMGDTGSLLLGSMAISCALSAERPLSIIPIGIIYVIEGVSVILQVLYYKATKKRLFKMAPLHHHLEKSGFSENKICFIAMVITLLCSMLANVIK